MTQDHLVLEDQWRVDGTHYHKTCDAWLDRLDQNREEAIRVLTDGFVTHHRWEPR